MAIRRYDLRYCDTGEDGQFAAQERLAMLAELLGLTSWHEAAASPPPPVAAVAVATAS